VQHEHRPRARRQLPHGGIDARRQHGPLPVVLHPRRVVLDLHLHRLLAAKSPSPAAASATLLAWLGGNGFLGAQFSWILRPFFGSPGLEVQFLRPDPLRGNFYQTVWRSLDHIAGPFAIPALVLVFLVIAIPIAKAIQSHHQTTPKP
jgi:hypothetical protein